MRPAIHLLAWFKMVPRRRWRHSVLFNYGLKALFVLYAIRFPCLAFLAGHLPRPRVNRDLPDERCRPPSPFLERAHIAQQGFGRGDAPRLSCLLQRPLQGSTISVASTRSTACHEVDVISNHLALQIQPRFKRPSPDRSPANIARPLIAGVVAIRVAARPAERLSLIHI